MKKFTDTRTVRERERDFYDTQRRAYYEEYSEYEDLKEYTEKYSLSIQEKERYLDKIFLSGILGIPLLVSLIHFLLKYCIETEIILTVISCFITLVLYIVWVVIFVYCLFKEM
jgi:hypothetical protein